MRQHSSKNGRDACSLRISQNTPVLLDDIIHAGTDVVEVSLVPSLFIQQPQRPLEFSVLIRDSGCIVVVQTMSLTSGNNRVCCPHAVRLGTSEGDLRQKAPKCDSQGDQLECKHSELAGHPLVKCAALYKHAQTRKLIIDAPIQAASYWLD